MNLKQLEYFVAVADLNSFTKAANLSQVAQPALSRQVRSLEVELGQHLLYRTGRGVQLTEAGTVLHAHAKGILAQTEKLTEALHNLRGQAVGKVVLGLPPSLAKVLALPLIAEFQRRYPHAQLSLVEGLSHSLTQAVREGRVDIGVAYNAENDTALEIQPLGLEPRYLFSSLALQTSTQKNSHAVNSTISLKQVAKLPLIIPSRPHAVRTLLESELAKLGLKPNIQMEIDGVPTILNLVQQDYGHAILGLNALGAEFDNGHVHDPNTATNNAAKKVKKSAPKIWVRKIVSPALNSTVSLIVSAQRPNTRLSQETAQLLREICQKHLHTQARR